MSSDRSTPNIMGIPTTIKSSGSASSLMSIITLDDSLGSPSSSSLSSYKPSPGNFRRKLLDNSCMPLIRPERRESRDTSALAQDIIKSGLVNANWSSNNSLNRAQRFEPSLSPTREQRYTVPASLLLKEFPEMKPSFKHNNEEMLSSSMPLSKPERKPSVNNMELSMPRRKISANNLYNPASQPHSMANSTFILPDKIHEKVSYFPRNGMYVKKIAGMHKSQ